MTPDGNAALAYDATMLLADAVRNAGPDRARIRAYLAGLASSGGYGGVTGAISFTPSGDPVGRTVVIARVDNGALVPAVAR